MQTPVGDLALGLSLLSSSRHRYRMLSYGVKPGGGFNRVQTTRLNARKRGWSNYSQLRGQNFLPLPNVKPQDACWHAPRPLLTSTVFQSNSSTFFMGKCGAWPLQNLVTIPKSMTEKGSLLYRGAPGTTWQRSPGIPCPCPHSNCQHHQPLRPPTASAVWHTPPSPRSSSPPRQLLSSFPRPCTHHNFLPLRREEKTAPICNFLSPRKEHPRQ